MKDYGHCLGASPAGISRYGQLESQRKDVHRPAAHAGRPHRRRIMERSSFSGMQVAGLPYIYPQPSEDGPGIGRPAHCDGSAGFDSRTDLEPDERGALANARKGPAQQAVQALRNTE
jgi:hypothetical protein